MFFVCGNDGLCLYVYGRKWFGHLCNSCLSCFLFSFVLLVGWLVVLGLTAL